MATAKRTYLETRMEWPADCGAKIVLLLLFIITFKFGFEACGPIWTD